MPAILIVDDEKLNRAGMKKIVSDSFPSLSVFDAKNGKEALAIITAQQIDLLITDVRMPIMDGIELMHAVTKLEKHPEIIVLSGYDDFSYVKEALTSGAVSYLLKPVDKKELTVAIEKAIGRHAQEEMKYQREVITAVLETGRIPKEVSGANFTQGKTFYCMYCTGKDHERFVNNVLQSAPHLVIDKQKNSMTFLGGEQCLELCNASPEQCECEVGVSLPSQTLTELRIMQRQSFMASFCRLYAPVENKIRVFRYNDEVMKYDFTSASEQTHKLTVILGTVKNNEILRQMDTLFRFEATPVEMKPYSLYYVYTEFSDVILKRYWKYSDTDLYLFSKSILIKDIAAFLAADEWITSVCDYLLYLNALLRKDCGDYPFISQALTYIDKHYMNNINMAMVANEVSVNYTYFSEKFKECEGINFNDYLRRLRIEKAKQLLENGCYKVYEVAERSGFSDVKYFIRNFKAETGLSPMNFRRKAEQSS